MRHYDLCVIGSGPAGQKAAIQAAKLGKSVCIVEKRSVAGGAAINTGTIPSKALREAILNFNAGGRPRIPKDSDFFAARSATFTGLMQACQEVIKAEISVVAEHFYSNGIELLTGAASFRDPHTIDIAGEREETAVSADFFLVGVGTAPARPASVPFNGQNIITSDELLTLPYLPHSMLVVGGGVIGTEYASMLQSLGVHVTLIEGRPRILEFLDSEISEALQYHLRQSGMTLRMGEKVVKIHLVDRPKGARSVNSVMAEATLESDKTLRADCLLYAIGRQGATNGLRLENAGLTADDRGRIKVNEFYQTSVPHIYAAGDVIGFPALASTSMEQGRAAAGHMFGEPVLSLPTLLPHGIYSVPEISMVGWTEEQLTIEGIPYEAGVAQYKEVARGHLVGDATGMLKLLIHQESHEVLGVHAIGTGATELVHIGQAVMGLKGTVEYFVNTVFNYPTLAECYKIAALNGLNKLRNV